MLALISIRKNLALHPSKLEIIKITKELKHMVLAKSKHLVKQTNLNNNSSTLNLMANLATQLLTRSSTKSNSLEPLSTIR